MNKACLTINATDSQIIYSAVSHSHKELFDWVGGKISILLTDKQRRENTNHGDKYTATTTEVSHTTRDTRQKKV